MDAVIRWTGTTLLVLGYVTLNVITRLRGYQHSPGIHWLRRYLDASLLWAICFALYLSLGVGIWLHLALLCSIASAALYVALACAFIQREDRLLPWWLPISLGGTLATAAFDLLSFPPSPQILGSRQILALVLGTSIWSASAIYTLFILWGEYRSQDWIVRRNRLRYLLTATTLILVGDVMGVFELPIGLSSVLLRLGGATLLTIAILRYQLPDMRYLLRRMLSNLILALLSIALYVGTAWGLVIALRSVESGTLLGVLFAAIFLAIFFLPLRNAIQRGLDRFLFGTQVDYEQLLEEYGRRISGELDLDTLTEIILETVDKAVPAEKQWLWILSDEVKKPGELVLRAVAATETPTLHLELDSVLLLHWIENGDPLTRYDWEIEEKEIIPEIRAQLNEIGVETLVPILAQRKLVGILGLGNKRDHTAYTPSDLQRLRLLASQTGVALQNARLFEQMKALSIDVMRLNAELREANRRLRELDRMKSAFIGAITHELRTPFASMTFALEVLRRSQVSLEADQQEVIEQLWDEVQAARTMIDQLVGFASLLSRQEPIQPDSVDWRTIVLHAIKPLHTMARSRDIRLLIDIPEQPMPIRGDAERLEEAVYHLVHNAIKFNHPGGQVEVKAWVQDRHAVIRVRDTGRGIPQALMERIWEPFVQQVNSDQRGREGLGIGLTLVRFVVEAHGGEVWASSKEGKGSTFGFRIPVTGTEVKNRTFSEQELPLFHKP